MAVPTGGEYSFDVGNGRAPYFRVNIMIAGWCSVIWGIAAVWIYINASAVRYSPLIARNNKKFLVMRSGWGGRGETVMRMVIKDALDIVIHSEQINLIILQLIGAGNGWEPNICGLLPKHHPNLGFVICRRK